MLAKDLKPGMMFLAPCDHLDPTCKCEDCVVWTVIKVELSFVEGRQPQLVKVLYVTGNLTSHEEHYFGDEPAWEDSELLAEKR